MSLPKLVAFQITDKAQNRYLGVIDDDDEPSIKGFLGYTADEAVSPFARFEIETAEDGLVHIRSCFTNKLWSRSSSNENWIVTSSNEQVKDKSYWECTLFKPNIEGTTVTFTHVQLQKQIIIKTSDDRGLREAECLCVDVGVSSAKPLKATFIDLTSLVKLPKFVTFKSDNKFLSASKLDCHEFISFSYEVDPSKLETTLFEVLHNHDGSVCFKYVKSGKLLGVSETKDCWLTIEHENIEENVGSPMFRFNPTRVSTGPVIALQSVYNSMYCKRAIGTLPQNLYATSVSIEDSEKMLVVELVSKRTIEVTRLRTEDFIFLSDSFTTVDTKIVDHNQMVEFKSEALETLEWSKTVSLMTDLSFSIESPTPYYDLANNAFKASERTFKADNYKWGTKQKFAFPVKQTIPVMVQPGTKIIAKLKAKSTRFQIPFDYTQTDINIVNGETKSYTNLYRDGLYTGEFYSDFFVEAENVMQ